MRASVIIPTANRSRLLNATVEMFLAQDFDDSELVILDDGEDQHGTQHWFNTSRVRYYHEAQKRSLGEKHNRLIELSLGEYILPWADDDWHAWWQVGYQVGLCEQFNADFSLIRNPLGIDAERKLAWHIAPEDGYDATGTLCFKRKIWERCPYEDVATGEDSGFFNNQLKHGASTVSAIDYRCYVNRVHRTNTASREQAREFWQIPFPVVQVIIGEKQFDRYFGGENGLPR